MRRGFTLLEVILALTLTVMLLGASMTFLWQLGDRRAKLSRGSRDLHAGAVLIERLESDLGAGLAGDAGIGAGVSGTATRLKLLTRGLWLGAGSDGAAMPVAGGAGEGDLQASEYEFDSGTGRLRARRYVVKPGGGAGGGGEMELVSDRVERVRFRYYDGKEWLTSYDSMATGTLPVAVEVAVWFTALKNENAAVALTEMGLIAPRASETTEEEEELSASVSMDEPVEEEVDTERRWPAPDRLRVIVVPDGPVTAWKEGA